MATVEPPEPDHTWEHFSARHPGNPFLGHDPLYALSEPIIDALQACAPPFFGSEQEEFERDLARTASFGFFLGQVLGEGTCDSAGEPGSREERHAVVDRQIKEMMAEEMRRDGVSESDIKEYFTTSRERRTRVENRECAYAGWLVTNPQFRREVSEFRRAWEETVRVAGRFPTLPRWLVPDATSELELPAEFREECAAFYKRWGVETMATWDWPVPMEPDFVGGIRRDVSSLSDAGISIFVPWYFLRGEMLELQEVVRLARTAAVPEHLADWVNRRTTTGSDDRGDGRYGQLLWLYHYHELVLVRRHATNLRGNQERVDCALAAVLGRDGDSVKKLRLQLQRALNAPECRPEF